MTIVIPTALGHHSGFFQVYSLAFSSPEDAHKAVGDSWKAGTSLFPYRPKDLPTAHKYMDL
jgi:hypothetical protein